MQAAIEALALRLDDSAVTVREAAADALGLLAATGAHPAAQTALQKSLSHASDGAKIAVCAALHRHSLRELNDVLAALIHDPHPLVRQACIQASAGLCTGEADIKTRLIEDSVPDVRQAAATALTVFPSPATIEALIAALGDEPVRETALTALDTLGWHPDSTIGATILALAQRDWKTLVSLGNAAVPLIERALRDPDPDKPAVLFRTGLVEVLDQIGSKEAIRTLEACLHDIGGAVRTAVARAIGHHPTQLTGDLGPALEQLLLNDPILSVRIQSAVALGRLGYEAASDSLYQVGNAVDEPHLQFASAEALSEMGDTALLIEQLQNPLHELRHEAAVRLGELRADDAVDPLIETLGDAYATVRAAAAEALHQLEWTPIGEKRDPDDPKYIRWVTRSEQRTRTGLANAHQADLLAKDLEAADPLIRQAALEALALRHEDTLGPLALPLLDDPVRQIRTTAAKTLQALHHVPTEGVSAALWHIAMGDFQAAARLGDIAEAPLLRSLREHPANQRAEAARTLTLLTSKDTIAIALREALADDESFVRVNVILALGICAKEEAVEVLPGLLNDPHSTVRTAAGRTLAAQGKAGREALEAQLHQEDPVGREAAARALSTTGKEAAFAAEALESLLAADHNVPVRIAAALALGEIPGHHQTLASAVIHDDAWQVRREAALALGKTAPENIAEKLLRCLGDSYQGVRKAALTALEQIGWKPTGGVGEAMLRLAQEDWKGLAEVGPPAIDLLMQTVIEKGADKIAVARRVRGVECLEVIATRSEDPRMADALAPPLSDLSGPVRAAAAQAVGRLKLTSLSDRLLDIAQSDSFEHARVRAAIALGLAGRSEQGPQIQHLAEHDDAPLVRRAAALALAGPAIGDITLLLAALSDFNEDVRRNAAFELGELGDTDAIDPLIDALGDAVATVRSAARAALKKLDWTPVGIREGDLHKYSRWITRSEQRERTGLPGGNQTELLSKDLHDPDPLIRQAALETLALRHEDTLAPLALPLLDDPIRRIRTTAAEALQTIHNVPSDGIAAALWHVAMGDLQAALLLGDIAKAPMIRALHEHPPNERADAAKTLALLGGDKVTEALRKALQDEDPFVRSNAIQSLGSCSQDASIDTLPALLSDPQSTVRTAAGRTLAGLGKAGHEALEAQLQHPDPVRREAAARALATVGSDAAFASKALESRLSTDKFVPVRVAAALALGSIPGQHPTLTAAVLEDAAWQVRRESAVALGKTNPDNATKALLSSLGDSYEAVRSASLSALEQVGWTPDSAIGAAIIALAQRDWKTLLSLGEPAIPLIARALSEPDPDKPAVLFRAGLVEVLDKIGTKAAIQTIQNSLHDIGGAVRAAVARAIGHHPTLVAGNLGADLEQLLLNDPILSVRIQAATALGALRYEAATESLHQIGCEEDEPHLQFAAAEALSEIGDSALLIQQLKSPLPELRLQAAVRLGQMKADGAVDPLIETLGDAYATVRSAASEALHLLEWTPVGEKRDPDDPKYVRWITRGEQRERTGLAEANQADLLAKELEDTNPLVRQAALETLGLRHDDSLGALALPLLDDPVRQNRTTAAETLQKLHSVPTKGADAALWYVAMGDLQAAALLGDVAEMPLIRALQEHTSNQRAEAARTIAMLEPKDAIAKALRAALHDEESFVRINVILALGICAKSDSLEALPALLNDPHSTVRTAAGRTLAAQGKVGHEALTAQLQSGSAVGREAAARALATVGPEVPFAATALEDRLAADHTVPVRVAAALALGTTPGHHRTLESAALHDEAWQVRRESALALGKNAPENVSDILLRCLGDSYQGVRKAGLTALEQIGWKPTGGVGEAMVRLAREDWQGLVAVGLPAIELLTQTVSEKGADKIAVERRVRAVECLEAIGERCADPRMQTALSPPLADVAGPVRAAAARAAGRLKLTSLSERLLEIAQGDPSERAQVQATTALGLAGHSDQGPSIRHLAENAQSPLVRLAAALALAGPAIGDIALLLLSLSDTDAGVRENAAIELGKIGNPKAIDPLIGALGDAVARVRTAARKALQKLDWVPVGIREGDEPNYRRWLTLDEIGAEPNMSQSQSLLLALKHPRAQIRRAGLEGLTALHVTAAVKDIQPLLKDSDPWVQRQASAAIQQLQNEATKAEKTGGVPAASEKKD